MSIEKKDLQENPEEQKQEIEKKLKGILNFNPNSKESEEFLNKTKGSDVIDAIKSDINSKLGSINDENTKQKIKETLKGFDKYAKLGKLSSNQAKELSDIYKEINSELGTENAENAQLKKDFQDKENQEKDKYKKLLESVEKLKKFLEGNHNDAMKKIADQRKIKAPEEPKPEGNPLEGIISEKNPGNQSNEK